MWHINSITVEDGSNSMIFGGLGDSMGTQPIGSRLGPEGAMYVLSVSGEGAICLQDLGATGGPGAWTVGLNNSTTTCWYYNGEGQGTAAVADATGDMMQDEAVTISGGTGAVTVGLLENGNDMSNLMGFMFTMIAQNSSLQAQWNNDPMQTLHSMGMPEDCMMNVDPASVQQMMQTLQGIQFPSGFMLAPEHVPHALEAVRTRNFKVLRERLGEDNSFSCWLCWIAAATVVTVMLAALIVVLLEFGVIGGPALAAAIAQAPATIAAAGNLGIAVGTVATFWIAALNAKASNLVSGFLTQMCIAEGSCSSDMVDCFGC